MMNWAASLPLTAAAGLGPLRFLPAAEACFAEERIWLKGSALSDHDELRLRQLPGAERFDVTASGELLPVGSLLPRGYLPSGPWQKLREFVVPELPPPRIVATAWPQLPLTLVRDQEQRDVAAVLTDWNRWEEYALTAPQVRLAPLRFAVSSEGQALVIGAPLPPLAGSYFSEESGIYIAAGWRWSPAVAAVVVRRVLQLQDDEFALWHAPTTNTTLPARWELIRRTDFVAARRAAIRATADGVQQEGART